jgi:acyl carrier protein
VLTAIANCADVESHDVGLATSLEDLRYLGLDSLVLVGLLLEAGESLGVDPAELIEAEIETVGDLVDVLERRRWQSRRRPWGSPQRPSGVSQSGQTPAVPNRDGGLQVVRTGIKFGNVSHQRVRIEITVTNTGPHATPRSPMRLQAAPLGAFLPWRDLATLWVPPLEPGATITVDTEVQSPRPRPLGRSDRVPPGRLMTALGMDGEDDAGRPLADQSKSARRGRIARLFGRRNSTAAQLPSDRADLIGRPNPHWAGNINVLLGNSAVERHRAEALRVYPGRTNMALMMVGNGRPDEYSFGLYGEGATWHTRLGELRRFARNPVNELGSELELGAWHAVGGHFAVAAIVEPPEWCGAGELEIHVTRRSTRQTAIVEFSLDPHARGPGCYTM